MRTFDERGEEPLASAVKYSALSDVRFPQMLLNVGFGFALVIAASCLMLSA